MAEYHIGLASVGAAIVSEGAPDDQVGKAIAVDVARRRNAGAGVVVCQIALDNEALRRCKGRKVDHRAAGAIDRAEAPCTTEHDIAFAGVGAAIVSERRSDDQVGETIAVYVPGRRDTPAGLVECRIALDDEALRGREERQIEWARVGDGNVGRAVDRDVDLPGRPVAGLRIEQVVQRLAAVERLHRRVRVVQRVGPGTRRAHREGAVARGDRTLGHEGHRAVDVGHHERPGCRRDAGRGVRHTALLGYRAGGSPGNG